MNTEIVCLTMTTQIFKVNSRASAPSGLQVTQKRSFSFGPHLKGIVQNPLNIHGMIGASDTDSAPKETHFDKNGREKARCTTRQKRANALYG